MIIVVQCSAEKLCRDIYFISKKRILYNLDANRFKGKVIVDLVDLMPLILTFFTLIGYVGLSKG